MDKVGSSPTSPSHFEQESKNMSDIKQAFALVSKTIGNLNTAIRAQSKRIDMLEKRIRELEKNP